jgi:hypothetical protein
MLDCPSLLAITSLLHSGNQVATEARNDEASTLLSPLVLISEKTQLFL